MRSGMRVLGALGCWALMVMAKSASAAESASATTQPDTESVDRAEPAAPSRAHRPGQSSVFELNALGGTFFGLRAQGIVHPASTWSLALEGLDGARIVNADGSVARTERGGGVRAELYVSSFRRDAAILAPGVDLMYQPRTTPSPSIIPSLDYKGRDPALLLETNADFMILHELAEHAGLLVGLRGGAVVALEGHDGSGKRIAGAVRPDGGIYVGVRF